MKTLKILFALAWMTLLSLPSASATTVVPRDLAELTADAEMIFIGTVIDIRSERQNRSIYTYVTFADLRVLKGSHLRRTIEVRLSGGTVAGETLRVFGMPSFVVGEQNLIFLAGNFQFLCPIVGWGQGRFKIRWDEVSRQEVVFDDSDVPVTDIRGKEIVRANKTRIPRGSPGVPERGMSLVHTLQAPETKVSLKSLVSAIETRMGIGSQLPARGKESAK
jgi:hypothetical protein